MKHFYLAFLLICSIMFGTSAKPLLVGHRGSIWGLENSVESFTNGAKIGYAYLETDLKVTSDGVFILSHDATTKRLGGDLNVAESTLEQLKAEDLTQTRLDVQYSGKICTLDEYLDVCAEYNVKPLIELKWATGINTEDCSNIPRFIAAVEAKGFRNNCVIITSMKNCLEYIHTNYPDVTIQYLFFGSKSWEENSGWCIENHIDVDIEAGCFEKSDVDKCHDAGLKVNVWTVNTNEGYNKYVSWGCDFITTDYLDPAKLPDLDDK